MLSLKYALSITLAVAVLVIALSGILQPTLSFSLTSVSGSTSPNSLTIEKGDLSSHSEFACLGCSGNGDGPG